MGAVVNLHAAAYMPLAVVPCRWSAGRTIAARNRSRRVESSARRVRLACGPANGTTSESTPVDRPAPRTDTVDISLLAPMMRDYVQRKRALGPGDVLLLYRVGDFFETFFEDAETFARVAGLALTAKEGGKALGQKVPMAGVPWHAINSKCRSLLDAGISVAICDQVEPSSATKNGALVKREITQLITPGTLLDDNLLSPTENNFLAAVLLKNDDSTWAMAYVDVSTGEFAGLAGRGLDSLSQQLCRVAPSEILIAEDDPSTASVVHELVLSAAFAGKPCTISPRKSSSFNEGLAPGILRDRFKIDSLEVIGCQGKPLLMATAAAIVIYIQNTLEIVDGLEIPLQKFRTDDPGEFLVLDPGVIRNLEVVKTLRDGQTTGTLFWAINRTATAMGARLLRQWLLQPSRSVSEINRRLDAVDSLANFNFNRDALRRILGKVYDIERLASKVASQRASPRDLRTLAESLSRLPTIVSELQGTNATERTGRIIEDLSIQRMLSLAYRVMDSMVEPAPVTIAAVSTESGSPGESLRIFRKDIYPELDALQENAHRNASWMEDCQQKERKRLGISSLKVSRISNIGWVIRIPRASVEKIASQKMSKYIPAGATKTELRFRTSELASQERAWVSSRVDLAGFEARLFYALRNEMALEVDSLRRISSSVAQLDVLLGFATVSVDRNYRRPKILPEGDRLLDLVDARHPVIEQSLDARRSSFVPNSLRLGSDPDFLLLTGPNASGKSCVLRQVGACQILAQIGCPVPAGADSSLSLCDRIFARVGAVDDLTGGQSTFMVEMSETAAILNHATGSSLVLLDEIGRGTAMSDGVAIAWSISEYLAKGSSLRGTPRAIFATHYHELNMLGDSVEFENVKNFQMELLEGGVPSFRMLKGGSWSSHGVAVAKRAGLPSCVTERAEELLRHIEVPAQAIGQALESATSLTKTQSSGTKPRVDGMPPSLPPLLAQQEAYADGYRAALRGVRRSLDELGGPVK